MEEMTRQEAYVESEEIYSEIRKEVEEFHKQIKPKIKILQDFADKHNLVVVNPLQFGREMNGAKWYAGKGFSDIPEQDKNVGRDSEFEYLDVGYDGCWISSSDLC